jgi:hypothetical protein
MLPSGHVPLMEAKTSKYKPDQRRTTRRGRRPSICAVDEWAPTAPDTSTPINSVPRPKTSEHAKPAKQQAALEHLEHLEPQEARFSRDSEAGSTSPRATAELAAIVIKSSHKLHKELLAGVPALQELSENELTEILQHVTVREYKDKEVIIEEGSAGKDMFIIQSGDAVCTKEGVNDGDRPYSFIDFVYM